jgi:glucosamine--fructose-6-phosphate aminotransferase (isomerizing)
MNDPGNHTRAEILSQPSVWEQSLKTFSDATSALRQLFHSGEYEQVLFTGCGSTYYLSLAAAALFQELVRLPACGLPASEIWLSPATAYPQNRRTLLVAVSRSGETTETLRACESFRKQAQGDLVTLSCYPGSSLANLGTLNLDFPSAQEKSVAQTRAFSTLYLATTALATICAGREDLFNGLAYLPEIGRKLIDTCTPLARQFGRREGLERIYFLGSGARYGLACELSLKMKEMSLSHSEPFHFLEFRHGPMSMVTTSTLLVGLLSEGNFDHERAVMIEMAAKGATLLTIGEREASISFSSGLDESLRNVLYLPAGQLLAFERALAEGLNPDLPANLSAVVRLGGYSDGN